jgi:hypothetical protein
VQRLKHLDDFVASAVAQAAAEAATALAETVERLEALVIKATRDIDRGLPASCQAAPLFTPAPANS